MVLLLGFKAGNAKMVEGVRLLLNLEMSQWLKRASAVTTHQTQSSSVHAQWKTPSNGLHT